MTAVRSPAGACALPLRRVEQCMGTVFSFDVRAPGIDRGTLDTVVAWLHDIDATYSTYRPDSVINRLADGRLGLAAAPREVRELLARCDDARAATEGWFDVRAGGRLDPSGWIKGWAVERACDMLAAAGSINHCVNGGGDVQCIGRPSPERAWRVGIADPHRPGRVLQVVQGSGAFGVATSGTSERGHHVINPHTGARPDALASVTVIAPGVLHADILATAALAQGPNATTWLRRRVDVDGSRALVVAKDGSVTTIGPLPAGSAA